MKPKFHSDIIESSAVDYNQQIVILSTFMPVSGKENNVAKSKRQENILRDMLDAAPDATLLVNEEGKIVLVSKQVEKDFGYDRQSLIGKPLSTLIPERFHDLHSHHQMGYFQNPRVRHMGSGLRLFGRRSDGSEFPVEISLSPLKTPDGIFAIAAIRDITERVDIERKLRQLNTLLVDAEHKERHRISQILHEDLQQRLFAIKAQLSAVNNAYAEKDWQALHAAFTPMEEWLTEAISITRDLSVDINPVIPHGESLEDSLTRLSAQMKKQYSLDVVLNMDEVKTNFGENQNLLLFQVVRELLFNVVKHAGILQATVGLHQSDDEFCITVSDEGKGFDPLTVMNTTGDAHGLFSIRERLDLMGCKMDVVSKLDAGTEVVIHGPTKLL